MQENINKFLTIKDNLKLYFNTVKNDVNKKDESKLYLHNDAALFIYLLLNDQINQNNYL